MKGQDKKLIFVYNANSDLASSMLDAIHKVVSPSTYKCNLCMITHSVLAEKSDWKEFRENLEIDSEFLHKDEFERKYKIKGKYPSVFLKNKGNLKEIIPKKEIDNCKDINDLKKLVKRKGDS